MLQRSLLARVVVSSSNTGTGSVTVAVAAALLPAHSLAEALKVGLFRRKIQSGLGHPILLSMVGLEFQERQRNAVLYERFLIH